MCILRFLRVVLHCNRFDSSVTDITLHTSNHRSLLFIFRGRWLRWRDLWPFQGLGLPNYFRSHHHHSNLLSKINSTVKFHVHHTWSVKFSIFHHTFSYHLVIRFPVWITQAMNVLSYSGRIGVHHFLAKSYRQGDQIRLDSVLCK